MDVWPGINESATNRQKAAYKIGSECQIIQHSPLQHYHRWGILKRTLRTLTQSPIDGSWINAINDIEDKDFAKPRNRLHYNNTWNFSDLHTFFTPLDYLNFSSPVSHAVELNPANPRFSIYLATSLLSVACNLLKDIGLTATAVRAEFELVSNSCDYSRLTARSKYELSVKQAFI